MSIKRVPLLFAVTISIPFSVEMLRFYIVLL